MSNVPLFSFNNEKSKLRDLFKYYTYIFHIQWCILIYRFKCIDIKYVSIYTNLAGESI